MRKGTVIPYISHVLAVAAIVPEFNGTEDESIAALLHDAVEDKKATPEEIGDAFGGSVTRLRWLLAVQTALPPAILRAVEESNRTGAGDAPPNPL